MPRSSPRLKASPPDDEAKPVPEASTPELKGDHNDTTSDSKKRKTLSKKDEAEAEPPKKQTKASTKKDTTKADDNSDNGKENDASKSTSKKKKTQKAPTQCITERDALPKLWSTQQAQTNGSYTLNR